MGKIHRWRKYLWRIPSCCERAQAQSSQQWRGMNHTRRDLKRTLVRPQGDLINHKMLFLLLFPMMINPNYPGATGILGRPNMAPSYVSRPRQQGWSSSCSACFHNLYEPHPTPTHFCPRRDCLAFLWSRSQSCFGPFWICERPSPSLLCFVLPTSRWYYYEGGYGNYLFPSSRNPFHVVSMHLNPLLLCQSPSHWQWCLHKITADILSQKLLLPTPVAQVWLGSVGCPGIVERAWGYQLGYGRFSSDKEISSFSKWGYHHGELREVVVGLS